ncbi:MAG: ribbon-helix-helix protein, CopG family [Bacteroidales bacterium]|nr:ribbon-helix-helix protein, CopG family [Bacteroidales bacterium]
MAQVTIYIPNELEDKVKKMASSLNISISKFIATALEQKVSNEWHTSCKKLAGSWNDFPLADEIREMQGTDYIREIF